MTKLANRRYRRDMVGIRVPFDWPQLALRGRLRATVSEKVGQKLLEGLNNNCPPFGKVRSFRRHGYESLI